MEKIVGTLYTTNFNHSHKIERAFRAMLCFTEVMFISQLDQHVARRPSMAPGNMTQINIVFGERETFPPKLEKNCDYFLFHDCSLPLCHANAVSEYTVNLKCVVPICPAVTRRV